MSLNFGTGISIPWFYAEWDEGGMCPGCKNPRGAAQKYLKAGLNTHLPVLGFSIDPALGGQAGSIPCQAYFRGGFSQVPKLPFCLVTPPPMPGYTYSGRPSKKQPAGRAGSLPSSRSGSADEDHAMHTSRHMEMRSFEAPQGKPQASQPGTLT